MRYTFQTRRAASGKYSKLGKAIEDNVIKEKKKYFFSLSATTFSLILMRLPTSIYDPK
jgi:hypothetical protein